MSTSHNNAAQGASAAVPPAKPISSENDKLDAAATTTVDSGFFSQELSSRDCSGLIEEDQRQQEAFSAQLKEASMRLDSGINTTQLASHLQSLRLDSSTNDLDKCKPTYAKQQKASVESADISAFASNTEVYYKQDENGDTCLHTAITENFLEAARILIKLAPHQLLLDTLNDEAQSPLHLAVLTRQWEVVRWLIVAGARPNLRNLCGDSPLHIAARNGDVNSCNAIIKSVDRKEVEQLDLLYVPRHTPFNLEQWNYEGETCLHLAALYGHLNVMQHLLDGGADVNAREGKSGYTVLHIAVETGNHPLTHYLITAARALNYDTYTYGGRSVLQLGRDLDYKLRDVLQLQGVPTYLSSEDEQDSESENDEIDEHTAVESQF